MSIPESLADKCYEYEGVVMPSSYTPLGIEAVKTFSVRNDDIFIITFPKSGTTVVQLKAFLLSCDGNTARLEGSHIAKLVPYLERHLDYIDDTRLKFPNAATGVDVADAMSMSTPRVLKTHIQPRWLPEGIAGEAPRAKVIFVTRNPKDTAVSFFHFCHLMPAMPKYSSWGEFLNEFMADRVPFGSWFDITLYWWNLRNHPNVLFLFYEDIIMDPRKVTVRIMEFMGKDLSDDVIDTIVDVTSFGAMKRSPSTDMSLVFDGVDTSKENKFFRKGQIGDWKNYFTVDQNDRFDRLYQERITDSGLTFRFK